MVLCSGKVIGFDTSDYISEMSEKLFCFVPLGVLEKSLKDSFLLSLSGKDKVVLGRANETAKVKETIKQVKFLKYPSKAAKFCWHSCFFKQVCSLFPCPAHICKNNTSITYLQSVLETSATPTHQ